MKELIQRPPGGSGDKCFVCGPNNPKGLHLKFYCSDHRTVTTELVPPQEWNGWEGLMHGGLQCVLLDETVAWTVAGLIHKDFAVTTTLEVRYRKPVRLNQRLTLLGRVLWQSERGSRVEARILGQDGEVLSEATAKVVHMNEKLFEKMIDSVP